MFKIILGTNGRQALGAICEEKEGEARFKAIITDDGRLFTDISLDVDTIEANDWAVTYYSSLLSEACKLILTNFAEFFYQDGKIFTISNVFGNKLITSYVIYVDGSVDSHVQMEIGEIRLATKIEQQEFIQKSIDRRKQQISN